MVRGRVGSWRINAKVERVFRTLKLWQRLSLWMLNSRGVQRKLHAYRTWYNHHRPHGALGVRTPEEAGRGTDPPTPIAFRHGGETEPVINLSREHFRGDPHMPLLHLRVVHALLSLSLLLLPPLPLLHLQLPRADCPKRRL